MMHFSKIKLPLLFISLLSFFLSSSEVHAQVARNSLDGGLKFTQEECTDISGKCEAYASAEYAACKEEAATPIGKCLHAESILSVCCRVILPAGEKNMSNAIKDDTQGFTAFYNQWRSGEFQGHSADGGDTIAPSLKTDVTEAKCKAQRGECKAVCGASDNVSMGHCSNVAGGSNYCCMPKESEGVHQEDTTTVISFANCEALPGGQCRPSGLNFVSSPCETGEYTAGKCFDENRERGSYCCALQNTSSTDTASGPPYTPAACLKKSGVCMDKSGSGHCEDDRDDIGKCTTADNHCCVPKSVTAQNAAAGANGNPSYNYTLLEKIPGIDSTNLSFSAYLSAVYKLAIWIVGLCALFMFLVGAFMYMLSAANTSKAGTAKSIMTDALIGLVLALSSYLILYVINPDLVNLKLPSVSMGGNADTGTVPSTPLAGAPPAGSGSGCGGLSVSANISSSQCNDASQPLSDVLACIKGKYPDAKITSISDGDGFDKCKNNWSKPSCDHAQTSCHYGGGVSQKSSDCNKSHAADFSVKNASGVMDPSIVESLKQAGSACGGRVHDETVGPAPHIHISDQTNCCTR